MPQSFTEEKWFMRWRHFAAYIYLIICIFDFIVMPIVYESNNRMLPVEALRIAQEFQDAGSQELVFTALMTKRAWDPITLLGAGTFHIAFGAILGAAAWTRGREREARTKYRTNSREIRDTIDNPDE